MINIRSIIQILLEVLAPTTEVELVLTLLAVVIAVADAETTALNTNILQI